MKVLTVLFGICAEMKARTILAMAILVTIAGLILFALFTKFGWPAIWFAVVGYATWWAVMTVVEDL